MAERILESRDWSLPVLARSSKLESSTVTSVIHQWAASSSRAADTTLAETVVAQPEYSAALAGNGGILTSSASLLLPPVLRREEVTLVHRSCSSSESVWLSSPLWSDGSSSPSSSGCRSLRLSSLASGVFLSPPWCRSRRRCPHRHHRGVRFRSAVWGVCLRPRWHSWRQSRSPRSRSVSVS